jgi:hypothetical protein
MISHISICLQKQSSQSLGSLTGKDFAWEQDLLLLKKKTQICRTDPFSISNKLIISIYEC